MTNCLPLNVEHGRLIFPLPSFKSFFCLVLSALVITRQVPPPLLEQITPQVCERVKIASSRC